MSLRILRRSIAAVLAAAIVGPVFAADTYLLLHDTEQDGLVDAVAQAGGTLDTSYPFGVSVAHSDNSDFASNFSDDIVAVLDYGFNAETTGLDVALEAGFPPNSGDDDFFFDLQWGHNYVGAQQAWAAGIRGQGVRVAVIDGGFDLDHPDIAPNLNLGLSMDFTGQGLQYTLPDPFSHGTHVAGTILAADNGFGVIGVAPEAELVALKALLDDGSGSFEDIIAAIYYAASVEADVINISYGGIIPRTEDPVGVSHLRNAVNRAVQFANRNWATVIVSAGNAATNLDGDRDNVLFMDAAEQTIPISALTTLNWASDPDNAELVPASYTNYGTSGVDFSAPGGSVDYPGNEGCVVAGLARPCWVFDLIFSTGNGGWYWSAGTSMAAPHASGVAALIISANGGDMHPQMVRAALRRYAEDGGSPGRDDFFGQGIVNSGY